MVQQHKRTSAPQAALAPEVGPEAVTSSNSAALAEMAQGGGNRGPFEAPVLNAALAECFGTSLDGLSADWAADENDAIGAAASTTGTAMSFGNGIEEDLSDSAAMETIGHETAHALAGGGSGQTLLDAPGDPGEGRADRAGKAFAGWVTGGMTGAAPKLSAAEGGRARTHRLATSTLTGSPSLKVGSSGALVTTLQTLLNSHGANPALLVDGAFGPRTDTAVRAFQGSHGLVVDGVVGPKTAGALTAAPSGGAVAGALTGNPSLRNGSSGDQVRILQSLLTAAGFATAVDGAFGPVTESKVRSYQASRGLTADGVVGPITANALNTGAMATTSAPAANAGPAPSFDPAGRLNDGNVAPGLKRNAEATCEALQDEGHEPYIVSVYRSMATQDALYDQGRTTPGNIVTWVTGGGSWHNYGCAVDIAFWNDAHTAPSWASSYPWARIGPVGLANGFTRWGGTFGDSPHLELHPKWGNSCYNLETTATNSGLPAVWSQVGAN